MFVYLAGSLRAAGYPVIYDAMSCWHGYDDKEHIAVQDYSRYNLVEPVVKPRNMTLDEVTAELGKASREFYMHKMNSLDVMSPKKREFMVKVVNIIATSSYLAKAMKGTMPQEVKRMLEEIKA